MKSRNEIEALIQQLNLPEDQARKMLEDIQAGDALFAQQTEPEIPAGLFDRIEQTVSVQQARSQWQRWLPRVAAILMFGVVVYFIYQGTTIQSVTPNSNPTIQQASLGVFEDELNVWETTLAVEDELEFETEEAVMYDVLTSWDDEGWDTKQLLEDQKQGKIDSEDFSA